MLSSRVGQRWIFRSNSGWFGGDRFTDLSVLTMCSAFVLMGLLILGKAGLDAMRDNASAQWPTAFGNILSAQVEQLEYNSDLRWFPRVTYRYVVHGRTVVNTQLTAGQQPHWRDRAEATQFLERYVARGSVVVYYNPRNISEAVLEPPHRAMPSANTALGIALLFLGVWSLIFYDWLR
jgi:hypothetical protein